MCRGACNEVWFDHEGLCIDTSSKCSLFLFYPLNVALPVNGGRGFAEAQSDFRHKAGAWSAEGKIGVGAWSSVRNEAGARSIKGKIGVGARTAIYPGLPPPLPRAASPNIFSTYKG